MADPVHIEVKVGRLPGKIQLIGLALTSKTVADALKGAQLGLPGRDEQIRVNGSPATTSTDLNEGAIVLLVRNVRGNA